MSLNQNIRDSFAFATIALVACTAAAVLIAFPHPSMTPDIEATPKKTSCGDMMRDQQPECLKNGMALRIL